MDPAGNNTNFAENEDFDAETLLNSEFDVSFFSILLRYNRMHINNCTKNDLLLLLKKTFNYPI